MGHAGNEADLDTLDIRETFRNHIYGCIIEDRHAIKSLDELGEDNIMCETDYPHSDSTWPNCIDVARDTMKDLPEHVQYKLLRGNAERLYRFTPAEPPVLANALIPWRAHWRARAPSSPARVRASAGCRPCASREEGARVVVADIELDNAKETVREIEAAGGTAIAVGVDVSDEQQVQAMIAAAVDQYGRLDILFNNVGIPTPRLGLKFEDHTLEDFNRLVAVNLGGVFLGCKHAVLQFKEQGDGGVILNTASVAGLVGWGGTVYGATKGGVIQLTRGVADRSRPVRDSRQRDLPCRHAADRVHGGGRAGRRRGQQAEIADMVGEQHPLGRAITAEDCAEAALYLVSDASRNVTGVALPIDGGFVAK